MMQKISFSIHALPLNNPWTWTSKWASVGRPRNGKSRYMLKCDPEKEWQLVTQQARGKLPLLQALLNNPGECWAWKEWDTWGSEHCLQCRFAVERCISKSQGSSFSLTVSRRSGCKESSIHSAAFCPVRRSSSFTGHRLPLQQRWVHLSHIPSLQSPSAPELSFQPGKRAD